MGKKEKQGKTKRTIGGLIGQSKGGKIDKCSFKGKIIAGGESEDDSIGSLIGQSVNTEISNSSAEANIILEQTFTKQQSYDDGQGNIKARLESLHSGLIRYKTLVIAKIKKQVTSEEEEELNALGVRLQREYGCLKRIIDKYGADTNLLLAGGNYPCEAFSSIFTYTLFSPESFSVVADKAIFAINVAIGELEDLQKLSQVSVLKDGKPYDAYQAIKDIICMATHNLMVADTWIDSTLFGILKNAQPDIKLRVLTQNVKGDFILVGKKFKKQYKDYEIGQLEVRRNNKSHDRFIIVNDSVVFHLGASIKDAGAKMSVIIEIVGEDVKKDIMRLINDYWSSGEKIL